MAGGADPNSNQEGRILRLAHGPLALPAFLPDATRGVVRGVAPLDLEACGIQAVMMNVFHLMQRPGSSTIRALGGLHKAFGWSRPIVTDSGGFQIYSLISQDRRHGSVSDRGLIFRPSDGGKINLTPEKSVRLQLAYGADVVICLDVCTGAEARYDEQRQAVRRTVEWARRCRQEYQRWLDEHPLAPPPMLLAVIQGGNDLAARRECAERLLEIGFDAYGLGGWPFDQQGRLLTEMIAYTRALIPARYPMHALGVGHPEHVVALWRMGYDLFDSALPTRDARRGRLLVLDEGAWPQVERGDGRGLRYLYIQDDEHRRDARPISPGCDCLACQHYSRAYLHHLFKIGDSLYHRLATIHNLRVMARLMAALRELDRSS